MDNKEKIKENFAKAQESLSELYKCIDLKEAGKRWIEIWLLPNAVDAEKRRGERGLRKISTVVFRSTKFGEVAEFEYITLEEPKWFDLNALLSDISDKCKVGCCWELTGAGDIMDTLVLEVKKLALK